MSFLGVKVILFLVIPLIIKEKSNASALEKGQKVVSQRSFSMLVTVDVNTSIDRSPCSQRSMRHDFLSVFVQLKRCFCSIETIFTPK